MSNLWEKIIEDKGTSAKTAWTNTAVPTGNGLGLGGEYWSTIDAVGANWFYFQSELKGQIPVGAANGDYIQWVQYKNTDAADVKYEGAYNKTPVLKDATSKGTGASTVRSY